MDIPHHPGHAKEVALGKTDLPQNAVPVPLEQLKLITDKPYKAIVTNQPSNTDNTAKTHTTPTHSSQTLAPTEWILKLNGKHLLINTNIPLETGQTLTVKLSSNRELLVQAAPPSSISSASTTSSEEIKLDNNAIATLLKSINQVMPRQVSLETGFKALNNVTSNNNSDLASQQAKSVITMLMKHIPKIQALPTQTKANIEHYSSTTTPPNPINSPHPEDKTSANISGRSTKPILPISTDALILALKNSGLFHEKNLVQEASKPKQFASEISLFRKAIMNSKQDPEQKNHSIANTNKTTTTDSSGTLHSASKLKESDHSASTLNLSGRIKTALNTPNLKANYERLAAEQSKASLTINQNTNIPNQSFQRQAESLASSTSNDLKGILYKTTAALTQIDNRTENKHPSSFVDALTQVELLKSPFNFPHLPLDPSQNNIQKASAILADQELTTGQLLKLIAGMLNRIQFNQLNSLYQSQSNSSESVAAQSWFMELPVIAPTQEINTFNLRIDREEEKTHSEDKNSSKKQAIWRIALSFDLENLGAIYVQVNLFPTSISSTIWANEAKTLALINREEPYFRSRLAQTGLEVSEICCQKGFPKQNKAKLEQSLVDIKA